MNRRAFLRSFAASTAIVAGGLSLTATKRPEQLCARVRPGPLYLSEVVLIDDPGPQLIYWSEVGDPSEWRTDDRRVLRVTANWDDWQNLYGATGL